MRKVVAKLCSAIILAIAWLTAEGHPEHLPRVAEESVRSGHEVTDASAGLLKYLCISMVFFGVVLQGLMVWMFLEVRGHFSAKRPSESALFQKTQIPPPRLQIDPKADLETLRQRNQEVLNSYGWVDRGKGIVRIPIDRAMELLAHGK